MTIQEAIARVDALKPNAYTPAEKIVWLNNIDMTIKAEVLDTHEGWEAYADFSGYTIDTDQDTDLLVGSPYDKLYEHWLEAQIDYTDGEADRYQNSMAMFMTAYSDYARWYNRNHAPLGARSDMCDLINKIWEAFMQLPKLTPIRAERQIINKFSGYNHNPVILDGANRYAYGEWYDVSGLTTDEYPTAAVRKPHGGMSLLGSGFVTGLFVARGKIGYTRGSSIYFYTGAPSNNGYEGFNLGLSSQPKQIIAMGAYRIIRPDWKYINVEDPTDSSLSKPIDEDYDTGNNAITLTPCDETGDETADVKDYVKFACSIDFTTGFSEGDTIGIHRFDAQAAELPEGIEGYHYIEKLTTGYMVFKCPLDSATTISPGSTGTNILVDRESPYMDFVFECENRLWGCRYGYDVYNRVRVNEIYASALGDFKNWHTDQKTSQDAYTASVGTDGPFTGACAFGGKPIFFKENAMHRVYGSYPAQYQIQTTEVQGVEKGAWRSLATVNNVLYYKSRAGIMAYDGASPVMISAPLGNAIYKNASAGGHKNKYFVTMMKEDEEYVTFVYDASRRLWEKHDNVSGLSADFGAIWQSCGDEMYATIIDTAFSTMREWYGTDNADGSPVEWYAETGDLGLDSPDRKRVTRLTLRMKMNVGSLVKVFIKYDDGEWEQQSVTAGYSLRSYSLPIRVKRCDHFRLRFEGMGYCQIYSITRTIEGRVDL